jgi:Flp pilus assembly pilin Flp
MVRQLRDVGFFLREIKEMKKLLARFARDEQGAVLLEYIVFAGIIITLVVAIAGIISDGMDTAADNLSTQMGAISTAT